MEHIRQLMAQLKGTQTGERDNTKLESSPDTVSTSLVTEKLKKDDSMPSCILVRGFADEAKLTLALPGYR